MRSNSMPSVNQDLGLRRVAQRVLGPRKDRARMLAVPLGGGHRDDAERQQRVLLAEPGHDDPLRLVGHRRLAELVLDRDRERAGFGAPSGLGCRRADLGIRSAGGQQQGGECEEACEAHD
jgi:hypothetical protein